MASSVKFCLTTLSLSLSLFFSMALITFIDNYWGLLKDEPVFYLPL